MLDQNYSVGRVAIITVIRQKKMVSPFFSFLDSNIKTCRKTWVTDCVINPTVTANKPGGHLRICVHGTEQRQRISASIFVHNKR